MDGWNTQFGSQFYLQAKSVCVFTDIALFIDQCFLLNSQYFCCMQTTLSSTLTKKRLKFPSAERRWFWSRSPPWTWQHAWLCSCRVAISCHIFPLHNPIILSCLHSHPPDGIRASWIKTLYPSHTYTHTTHTLHDGLHFYFLFPVWANWTGGNHDTINRCTGWTEQTADWISNTDESLRATTSIVICLVSYWCNKSYFSNKI